MSCYSHAVGVPLSIAGLVALLVHSADSPKRVVGFSIYGATLVLLYAASSSYHALAVSPRWEDLLRRLDHAAIFLLIAGSYTPVCLVTLPPAWGWSLFGVVWGVALTGVVTKLCFSHLPRSVTSALYIGMGWLAVVAVGPLVRTLPNDGLAWLVGGGLAYTAGGVIYALKRPDPWPDFFGFHEVFHVFVLAGSVLHFVFMLKYVAPAG